LAVFFADAWQLSTDRASRVDVNESALGLQPRLRRVSFRPRLVANLQPQRNADGENCDGEQQLQ